MQKISITKKTLVSLANGGEFELIHELQRHTGNAIPIGDELSRYAYDGPRRSLILPHLANALVQSEPASIRTLQKLITLSELLGKVSLLSAALRAARDRIATMMGEHRSLTDSEALAVVSLCFQTFTLAGAKYFLNKYPNIAGCDLLKQRFIKLERLLEPYNLNIDDLLDDTNALASNNVVRLEQPTVIWRLATNFWKVLDLSSINGDSDLDSEFTVFNEIKSLGFGVRLFPQFCNAGPAFASPYSLEDANMVCSIGFHKFSSDPSRRFLHRRNYLSGRYLIDRGGYSGWLKMPTLSYIRDNYPHSVAVEYCSDRRNQVFINKERPADIPFDRPFLFIALQLQGDSVEDLAYRSADEMLTMCYDFFNARGWNIVIKKHPKDINPGTTLRLERIAQKSGVYISTAPSPQLVMHSNAVALVNSSVGWEAILANKPLFTFGIAEYSELSHRIKYESDLHNSRLDAPPFSGLDYDLLYYYFFQIRTVAGRRAINEAIIRHLRFFSADDVPPPSD